MDDKINPRYLAKLIEKEGFNLRFSRSNRASIDRISDIEVSLPTIKKQNKIVSKVVKLENKIFNLESKLDELNHKKEDFLRKILEIE